MRHPKESIIDRGDICAGSIKYLIIKYFLIFCIFKNKYSPSNPAKAVIDHCKGVTVLETPTAGGVQKMKFISDGDVTKRDTFDKKATPKEDGLRIAALHLTLYLCMGS